MSIELLNMVCRRCVMIIFTAPPLERQDVIPRLEGGWSMEVFE